MDRSTTTAPQDYRLISADSHVNEPPDLWTKRVPAALRDRAPRMERFDEGDAWVIEGVRDPVNFGWNACAGLPADEMTGWVRFEELRRGGYDPAARLEEMSEDGVDAEVLYPTPRLSNAIVANRDTAYHLAMVQAYNDWLSEYVAYAPARFAGLAIVPNRGADHAVAEIQRLHDRPGIRGFMMGCYPNGTLAPSDEDDAVWGLLAELGSPINIHVALTQTMPSAHKAKLPGWGRIFDVGNRMIDMVFSGIFDRFPGLDVVVAEVDCGWLPYVKEQIDNNYGRLDPTAPERIHVLEDGEEIEVSSNRRLTTVDSPGHAKHHLALHDDVSGLLFAGDAVGVRLPDVGILRPATPPPDFDLDQAITSLRAFADRRPAGIALAHYGLVPDPEDILVEAEDTLRSWAEVAERAWREDRDITDALESAFGIDDDADMDPVARERLETLSGVHSNAQGLRRWLETRQAGGHGHGHGHRH